MASVHDVAKFITEQIGEIPAMKLQKLAFYSQAWHMVWEDQPLFAEDFEAWANGPVSMDLYHYHRGMFAVDANTFRVGNSANLNDNERESIQRVISFYGQQTAQWLSNLTHQERPWLDARGDLPPGAISRERIAKSSIHEYYSAL